MKRLWYCLLLCGALACHAAVRAQAAPPAPRHQLQLPAAPGAAAAEVGGSVQFIGTATVLIRFNGMIILTDPNFLHKGEHVHLGYGLTSERLTNPAIEFDQLPPIDLVLLSHLHEDHFDKLVERKLNRATPIVTTEAAARKLQQLGFQKTYGLAEWQSMTVSKGAATLTISAMPARHGPVAVAPLLPPVMGSMLEFAPHGNAPYRLYVSGDTMVYDDIEDIPRRFPNIDLTLLHLGGTRLLGVATVTMDGDDGVRMLKLIAPQRAIPIHYNDYDVFKSPLSEFQQAVERAGLQDKVSYLKPGESYTFPPPK
jgi:L-ascorbate metabolism protein UlaG (beta-lactamase superfamily)